MTAHLLSKLDQALVAYLISRGAGTIEDTFAAKRSADKRLPCTICYSERAVATAPYANQWVVSVAIMVKTNPNLDVEETDAEAKKTDSDERVQKIFDAFVLDVDQDGSSVAALITQAGRAASGTLSDFTVDNVEVKGPEAGFETKNDIWIDTLNLEIVCRTSAEA